MLKRLTKSDWTRARMIHKFEGEMWLERDQCTFTLNEGTLSLKTMVDTTLKDGTPTGERFEMESFFKEEDISYIAYYQPSLITVVKS